MLDLISEIVSVVIIYVYLSGYPPQTGLLIEVRAVSVKKQAYHLKMGGA